MKAPKAKAPKAKAPKAKAKAPRSKAKAEAPKAKAKRPLPHWHQLVATPRWVPTTPGATGGQEGTGHSRFIS